MSLIRKVRHPIKMRREIIRSHGGVRMKGVEVALRGTKIPKHAISGPA
jgi:hypothetical protein